MADVIDSPTRLKRRMWELDLTQTQLAERSGLSFWTVNKIFNGQIKLSERSAFKLARALELPLEALNPDDFATPADPAGIPAADDEAVPA